MHNDHNEKIENPFSNSSCVVCIGPEIHWICWKTFNDNLVNESPHVCGYYTSLGWLSKITAHPTVVIVVKENHVRSPVPRKNECEKYSVLFPRSCYSKKKTEISCMQIMKSLAHGASDE